MALELFNNFREELEGVRLVPGAGGVFEVRVDGQLVFSKKERGRFPELKEVLEAVYARLNA